MTNTKQRSDPQNRSIHKGCQQIADLLVENGISLDKVIRNLEIRPTMNSIKDIFRHIARKKYGIESTADLESGQIDPVWDDLVKSISQVTGVFVPFPSRENTENYLQSLEDNQPIHAKKQKTAKAGAPDRKGRHPLPKKGNKKP